MKRIRLFAATALLATVAVTNSFAQYPGADCGCPPLAARTPVELNTIFTGTFGVIPGPGGNTLDHDAVLTCEHTYIMRNKLYVINGATLTIMPGTIVKGVDTGVATDAAALIITRGSKIIANGTASAQIIFTALDDNLDGNYPIGAKQQWGGLVLLGKATNNLIATNASCTGPNGVKTAGIGFVEGYDASNEYNQYGGAIGSTNDNDNSGVLKYVSIRHAGAVLQLGNELNGLTLGSVGSGTIIDYVDIVANADDGIEFFGGTVNVKHIAMWWGNDDMFDWDLGWKGKAQFLFGIQSSDVVGIDGGDNGFESDGDDNKTGDAAPFMSHPIVYNATIIGNGLASANDFTGPSAIRAKERTEGEIYNSVFANFKFGLDISSARAGLIDSYQNWTAATPSLIVKNNTFINMTDVNYGGVGLCISTKDGKGTTTAPVRRVATTGAGSEMERFTNDGNTYLASLPGFDFNFAMSAGTLSPMTPGGITDKFDAVPNPQIAGETILSTHSLFFTPVSYRGAFGSNEKSWMSEWSFGEETAATSGLLMCPNDVNLSGGVNNDDLNSVLGAFGTSCQ